MRGDSAITCEPALPLRVQAGGGAADLSSEPLLPKTRSGRGPATCDPLLRPVSTFCMATREPEALDGRPVYVGGRMSGRLRDEALTETGAPWAKIRSSEFASAPERSPAARWPFAHCVRSSGDQSGVAVGWLPAGWFAVVPFVCDRREVPRAPVRAFLLRLAALRAAPRSLHSPWLSRQPLALTP
jgi:hypothetical protein